MVSINDIVWSEEADNEKIENAIAESINRNLRRLKKKSNRR